MSYQRVRLARRVRRPKGHRGFVPMGDTITVWGQQYDCATIDPNTTISYVVQACNNLDANYSVCAKQADVDTKPLDDMAYSLAQSWHPLDTVTPAELRSTVSSTMALVRSGYTALENAAASAPETQQDLIKQMNAALNDIGSRAIDYTTAANQADATQATVISAPGLKQFVLDAYNATSSAIHASSVVLCQVPSWVAVLGAVTTAAQGLYAAASAVVGKVIEVGEKVVQAAEAGIDMITMIEKIAPFAAVGLAAWWLFLREKKRKG